MTMTDPIADMLTRIRNANIAMHDLTEMPSSKLKVALARILQQEGYIEGYEVADDPKRLNVAFLSGKPDVKALDAVDRATYEPDVFEYTGGREIYLWLPGGMGRTKIMQPLSEKKLGVRMTVRNWNTVLKLAELTQA